jgi:hypothetical protein
MKFEMTKCNRCGSEMLMGLDVCPSCGQRQSRSGGAGPLQPRIMLAIGLSAAVLFVFNWIKPAPSPSAHVTAPPSTSQSR